MAKKVKVELNREGVGQLLKSKETMAMVKQIAEEHSGGWNTDAKVLGTRAVASIYSTDHEEVAEELETHSIVGGLR